jgi:hypothetical protein
MSAIHVIRKNDPALPRIELIDRDSDLYRSGYWVLSEETARSLVGGKIYFHREQSKPSFFGGTIRGAEKIKEGVYAGRILFTFRFEEACRGIRTERIGWAQEMKLSV